MRVLLICGIVAVPSVCAILWVGLPVYVGFLVLFCFDWCCLGFWCLCVLGCFGFLWYFVCIVGFSFHAIVFGLSVGLFVS